MNFVFMLFMQGSASVQNSSVQLFVNEYANLHLRDMMCDITVSLVSVYWPITEQALVAAGKESFGRVTVAGNHRLIQCII